MNKDHHVRLREAKDRSCNDISCTWFDRAVEVITLNKHNVAQYSQDMYNCWDKGRYKDRIAMLIGPANTAKTSMLKHLQLIFGKNFSKTRRVQSLAGWAFKMLKSFSWTITDGTSLGFVFFLHLNLDLRLCCILMTRIFRVDPKKMNILGV